MRKVVDGARRRKDRRAGWAGASTSAVPPDRRKLTCSTNMADGDCRARPDVENVLRRRETAGAAPAKYCAPAPGMATQMTKRTGRAAERASIRRRPLRAHLSSAPAPQYAWRAPSLLAISVNAVTCAVSHFQRRAMRQPLRRAERVSYPVGDPVRRAGRSLLRLAVWLEMARHAGRSEARRAANQWLRYLPLNVCSSISQ